MASYKVDKKIVGFSLESTQKDDTSEVIVTDVSLPTDAKARLKTLKAEGKKWYLTVAYHPDSEIPFALFCHTNHPEKTAQTSDAVSRLLTLAKNSGILQEHIDGLVDKMLHDNNVSKLTRAISLLLRHRVRIASIVAILDSMEDVFVGSFLFQIKKFLSQYVKNGEKVEGSTCSNCGSTNLVFAEGCMQCLDCNASKCS